MSYRERPAPPETGGVVACLWEQDVTASEQRVLPDGCVDVIWFASGRLLVAGPDTGAVVEQLDVGDRAVGVRLAPGAAGSVLDVDASSLRDQRTELSDAETLDRLHEAADPHRTLLDVLEVAEAEPDPAVRRAVDLLAAPGARVAAVADELGLSERQLHRRVRRSVGYGPKTLARVLRLRRLQVTQGEDLATRARVAGYASQAHMGDEVRELTGLTPTQLLTG